MRICVVAECTRPMLAREMCGKHYRAWRAARPVEVPERKDCVKCGRNLPIESFSRHSNTRDRRRPECRDCHARYHKDQRAKTHRDVYRRYELKRKYKITLQEFNAQLAKQHGRCAICGIGEEQLVGRWRTFAVDHDHESGKIRGLLCQNCNFGLGLFLDDPKRLASAIEYLARFKCEEA